MVLDYSWGKVNRHLKVQSKQLKATADFADLQNLFLRMGRFSTGLRAPFKMSDFLDHVLDLIKIISCFLTQQQLTSFCGCPGTQPDWPVQPTPLSFSYSDGRSFAEMLFKQTRSTCSNYFKLVCFVLFLQLISSLRFFVFHEFSGFWAVPFSVPFFLLSWNQAVALQKVAAHLRIQSHPEAQPFRCQNHPRRIKNVDQAAGPSEPSNRPKSQI